jgi:nitrite reductase (cytochrome c-552)
MLSKTATGVGALSLMDMIDAVTTAEKAGAPSEQLAPALVYQRSAQWRIDFVYSEGSHGFHASHETARILAEAIDFARRGEAVARTLLPAAVAPEPIEKPELEGFTPPPAAPPSPYDER